MIKYDLNIREPYGGGGLNPAWSTPISSISGGTTFEESAYSTLNSFVPGASKILNSLGIGPDKWSTVETRTRNEVKTIIDYGVKKYLKGNQLRTSDLTAFDKYIVADSQYRKNVAKTQSSTNSRKRSILMFELLTEYLNEFRQSYSGLFDMNSVVFNIRTSGITSYKNVRFTHSFIPNSPSMVYSAKSPKHVVTSVKPSKIPQTITTTTVAPHVLLPTDSEYLGTDKNGNADDIYKSPWYVVIVVVIIVAVGLGLRWIWKKLKKK
ncbi:hypothetical protein [Tenacibaculum ovolyticum]|uniref:hypothetical protein n=1 Tax=Tenacibaculum ovolyticum TaxID=104270 RepID=UPI000426C5EC|nr:hypothetical protein [Tenacibaculum ovolyticum]